MAATKVTDPSAFREGSLGLQAVLFIITGGLYGAYWFYSVNSQIESGTDASFDPVIRTLLMILLGPFLVGLYWMYLTCQDAEILTDQSDIVLFVLFLIPVANIAAWYFIQTGINETASGA